MALACRQARQRAGRNTNLMSTSSPPRKTAVKTARRNAGRPSESNSVGREAILASAIELLHGKTPEQLTLAEVAAKAKVDRALIRYYFSDKTGLLKAIAYQVVSELQGRSQAMFHQEGTLEEKIKKRLDLLIDIMHEMPQFAQLVFKEIYYAEIAAKNGDDARAGISQSIVDRGLALTRVLIDSDEVDDVGRDMDPRFLHIMMLGSCIFFATSQPLLQLMFGDEFDRGELTRRYVDFATKMLMRGLGAPLPGP